MSNDVSWLPGIGIAVRHFVSVFTGAPGPAHGPATATVAVASQISPKNTHTTSGTFSLTGSLLERVITQHSSLSYSATGSVRVQPTARDYGRINAPVSGAYVTTFPLQEGRTTYKPLRLCSCQSGSDFARARVRFNVSRGEEEKCLEPDRKTRYSVFSRVIVAALRS